MKFPEMDLPFFPLSLSPSLYTSELNSKSEVNLDQNNELNDFDIRNCKRRNEMRGMTVGVNLSNRGMETNGK